MLWIDHLHPDDRDRVRAESDRTDRTGEPFSMEYRTFAKDGREVWLRDESSLVAGQEGQPPRVQGVMFDITARKRAELALQQPRTGSGRSSSSCRRSCTSTRRTS